MGHYKSNVRDLEFNLFEVLELEKALATGEFGDLDGESVRQMLDEASPGRRTSRRSFADSDRHPPTFDPETHAVTFPEPFKESLAGLAAGRVVPGRARRGHRRCARARDGVVGDERLPLGANPRRSSTWQVRSWRTSCFTSATNSSGIWA